MRRGSGEENVPFFTKSADALSLATNRDRKMERNKGKSKKKRKKQRSKWC